MNQAWRVGPFSFAQRIVDAQAYRHIKKHILSAGNIVSICRYIEGYVSGRSGDVPFTIHPGDISIRDSARPFEAVQLPAIFQVVFIPHDMIGFDPGQHPAFCLFEENSTMGCVLHAELDCLFTRLMQGDKIFERARLNRFMACVKVAFSGGKARRDIRADARDALGDVIRQHIEANLECPTLSMTSVLQEFGVSRATLYRIFEADGGVRKYINDRRLYQAVFQISENPITRGEITKAAQQWGFSSDANFNRAVRRKFGVSPNSMFERPIGTSIDQWLSQKGSRAQTAKFLKRAQAQAAI